MEENAILSEIKTFLDAEGKLKQFPSKYSKQKIAIEYLAGKFESGRSYTEKEVNEIINQNHTFSDWTMLRRFLVDYKFLARTTDGKEYHKV